MTVLRMDNVSIIVEDLSAAIAFFRALGLELEGTAPVEGGLVDRLIALENVRVEIAMMRTPDRHSRIELTKFERPAAVRIEPEDVPVNVLGIRRIMFAVDDIDEVLRRLREVGGELLGTIEQYESSYRLCYVRGPEGILIALAQEVKGL